MICLPGFSTSGLSSSSKIENLTQLELFCWIRLPVGEQGFAPRSASSHCMSGTVFSFVCFFGGQHTDRVQVIILGSLQRQEAYGMLGIDPGLIMCRTNVQRAVLSLEFKGRFCFHMGTLLH